MPLPSIPSGTISIFCQPSSPVGWTKLTSLNDYALRIVSGTTTSGGTSPFTTCFSDTAVTTAFTIGYSIGSFTLSNSTMAAHTHPSGGGFSSPIGLGYPSPTGGQIYQASGSQNIGPAGGGGSHSHTVPASSPATATFPTGTVQTLALRYIDVIQCSRN